MLFHTEVVQKKEVKELQRRRHLKMIKKKFGLAVCNMFYTVNTNGHTAYLSQISII